MEQMIAQDEVRSICLSKKTYDVSKFGPYIEVAEQKFIMPFLGAALYNEIRTQYKADDLSTLNATLVNDYLKPALAWFVLHLALPFIQMDITSSGIQINNSEFASSGTDKQRADLVNSTENIAQTFLDKAKYYLEEVAGDNDYPLYSCSDNIDNNTTITGGIILDNE